MTYSRPSALLLACSLLVGILSSAGADVALAKNPPPQCTGWTDQYHPPTTIRVRISRGPTPNTVATVPFWDYVATVEAAEWSTSGPRTSLWYRMGALAVKDYGWYYAMHWRGGYLTITNADGTTTNECFDVRDTTADQIYKPVHLVNGQWIPANTPSAAQIQAMNDTWAMSLRKWVPKKLTTRLFLSGYRSGKKHPCGSDSDGFRLWQKSVADCIYKGMDYEETQRRYYEPNVLIVDPRKHDILDDDDVNGQPTYFGDLGVLSAGASHTTTWHVYAGTDTGFADDPVTGSFGFDASNVTGEGLGDVNQDGRKDLIMLVNGKLRVALATGTGYADLSSPQDVPGGISQLVVGDFNGDLIADIGLLRSTPVAPLPTDPATMVVMLGKGDGTFAAPVDWWRGALDLSTQQVQAGDVNGDGKADLVIRDGTAGVSFLVAPSFASCADPTGYQFTYTGPCQNVPGTGLDVATPWFTNANWSAATTKWTLTDFNTDGRADVVAMVPGSNNGVDFYGMQSTVSSPGFGNQSKMLHVDTTSFADTGMLGMDINPDGMGDLLLVKHSNANTAFQWLRASQTAGSAAITYVATTPYVDASVPWAPATTDAY